MDHKYEIIQEFNNDIDSFLEFLKILAPSNMKQKIIQIEMFKHANKISPIEYFSIYVFPYKKYIDDNDVEYFLNKDLIEMNGKEEVANDFKMIEEIIKSIWTKLSKDNKDCCIKHLKILMDSSVEYIKYIINKSIVSYDILNGLMALKLVSASKKYEIVHQIMEKNFDLANDNITEQLLKLS